MNDYENPMVRPLSNREEYDLMSDEEIEELPKCNWCGEGVVGKYKGSNMHPSCWAEGKAEYDIDRCDKYE